MGAFALTVMLGCFGFMYQASADLRVAMDAQLTGLRDDLRAEMDRQHAEIRSDIKEIRVDVKEIQSDIVNVRERVTRIETHLGVAAAPPGEPST